MAKLQSKKVKTRDTIAVEKEEPIKDGEYRCFICGSVHRVGADCDSLLDEEPIKKVKKTSKKS